MGDGSVRKEWVASTLSALYFVHNYCHIYDATAAMWIPFRLWQGQAEVLHTLQDNRLVIILKARQLGQTWLVLCYALWLMLFHPVVTILLFSRRDEEAQYLLERLRGIYDRLPQWMQARRVLISNSHEWHLSNGSVAYAFPTTAGDSYTASMAIVDEADLVPNLDFLMNAVKPTIDGGGRMILLSRSNKDEPQSPFKRMYRAAKEGKTPWKSVFLPWYIRPGRDIVWYEAQKSDILGRTGSLDDLWQQYPSEDTEALIPRTLDKRIPATWVTPCYVAMKPIESSPLHTIHQELRVYVEPQFNHQYVIGADPAEGNPTSDPSALVVIDCAFGEEVASLNVRAEPSVFAEIAIQLALAYNNASILPERNNHGHVVIKVIKDDGRITLLAGIDGVAGWHTNAKSKSDIYSTAADTFRYKATVMHSEEAYYQICGVEGRTLKAPDGEYDDLATAYVLAIQAMSAPAATSFVYSYIVNPAGGMVRPVKDRRMKDMDTYSYG